MQVRINRTVTNADLFSAEVLSHASLDPSEVIFPKGAVCKVADPHLLVSKNILAVWRPDGSTFWYLPVQYVEQIFHLN